MHLNPVTAQHRLGPLSLFIGRVKDHIFLDSWVATGDAFYHVGTHTAHRVTMYQTAAR